MLPGLLTRSTKSPRRPRQRSWGLWPLTLVLCTLDPTDAAGAISATSSPELQPTVRLGPLPIVTPTSWVLLNALESNTPWRLKPHPKWMSGYLAPSHAEGWRSHESFRTGRYGPTTWQTSASLSWDATACSLNEPSVGQPSLALLPQLTDDSSLTPAPPFLPHGGFATWATGWVRSGQVPPPAVPDTTEVTPCTTARTPLPVRFGRYGRESDSFVLLNCAGEVTAESMDRLSVLMRPPGAERPSLPLPLEPTDDSGEWVPEVRMVHPRLVWLLSKIAERFPYRSIYIYSGYRRQEQESLHRVGRAVDIAVSGVQNEVLFGYCRTLRDVGCGYYPNHAFVHVDVRRYGSPLTVWVDDSEPGHPSRYVDGWPGVLAPGVAAVRGN